MKKVNITPEDELYFMQMEEELNKKLTFQDIQEMNKTISFYKKEYFENKSKSTKILMNFTIIFIFGLLFSIKYGVLLIFPFAAILLFLGYKLYVFYKKIKFADIMIGNLEFSKKEYFNSI